MVIKESTVGIVCNAYEENCVRIIDYEKGSPACLTAGFSVLMWLLNQTAFVRLVLLDDILDVIVLEKKAFLVVDDDHRNLIGYGQVVRHLMLRLVDSTGNMLPLRITLEVDLDDIPLLDAGHGVTDGENSLEGVERSDHLAGIVDDFRAEHLLVLDIGLRRSYDIGEQRFDFLDFKMFHLLVFKKCGCGKYYVTHSLYMETISIFGTR